jgi:hypothetical protein
LGCVVGFCDTAAVLRSRSFCSYSEVPRFGCKHCLASCSLCIRCLCCRTTHAWLRRRRRSSYQHVISIARSSLMQQPAVSRPTGFAREDPSALKKRKAAELASLSSQHPRVADDEFACWLGGGRGRAALRRRAAPLPAALAASRLLARWLLAARSTSELWRSYQATASHGPDAAANGMICSLCMYACPVVTPPLV